MWKGKRLTAHQWAFCTYHLKMDRLEDSEHEVQAEQYRAYLMNLSLLAPKGLEEHIQGRDAKPDIIEEDAVFRYRAPEMSEEAMKVFGIGKYAQVPAISPVALARGMKNE